MMEIGALVLMVTEEVSAVSTIKNLGLMTTQLALFVVH